MDHYSGGKPTNQHFQLWDFLPDSIWAFLDPRLKQNASFQLQAFSVIYVLVRLALTILTIL
jgi:hypothetical protein